MTKRMLIDSTHDEETRVAVVSGNRLEDYDFESITRQQLKSNIYLVKVTRVEPSLQAAFVDYGGNRHGFLPFPEIHPDYYKIPVSDRENLLAEQEAIAKEEEDKRNAQEEQAEKEAEKKEAEKEKKRKKNVKKSDDGENISAQGHDTEDDEEEAVPQDGVTEISSEDPLEEEEATTAITKPARMRNIKRHYKIQEVVQRNQVMLIQIRKEERGNKGAAVTSYLSLPGRYCVLMPNSPRAGGVSRKVTNMKDRHRMKKLLQSLDVPEGMSVILRTAGLSRTKVEIKRDLDYLLRLWDNIRQLTLNSTAPKLVHEEGNLVKRVIRDLYKREIDEILVAGENGYKTAKDFMRTLMPSHAKRVKKYKDDTIPLFFRYQVENQIDEIHSTEVHMKSGSYIVINPTEALVSVDVNSGRATSGRHIEETALKTNIEAAEEVARQLRLRDLGGLVVIDFIDMEDPKNNRTVERKLKEAMQHDRARLQMGRISAFGLLELSRQRLRPSLVESNFEVCAHCKGTGLLRTIETSAVIILRALEEEGLRGRAQELKITVPTAVALYVFNQKRDMLAEIETRHSFKVTIETDDNLVQPDFTVDITQPKKGVVIEQKEQPKQNNVQKQDGQENPNPKRKRNRRRRRNNNRDQQNPQNAVENQNTPQQGNEKPVATDAPSADAQTQPQPSQDGADNQGNRKPRRRHPSNRRRPQQQQPQEQNSANDASTTPQPVEQSDKIVKNTTPHPEASDNGEVKKPTRRRRPPRKRVQNSEDSSTAKEGNIVTQETKATPEKKPETTQPSGVSKDDTAPKKRTRRRPAQRKKPTDDKADKTPSDVVNIEIKTADKTEKKPLAEAPAKEQPKDARKGWWQRLTE